MRIFGSWTEIKNLVFRKGSRQVTIEPSTQTVGDGTINVPDMAGTTQDVVLRTQAQALTNKTVVVASNTVTTAASGNLAATELNAALSELQSDIDTRATSSSLSTHTGASSGVHGVTGSVVGTTDIQTLTNKTLTTPVLDVIDSAFNIQNNGGPTKKAQFDCSLIPSATTRIFTFPNTAGSVITTDLAIQTLVNKDIDGGTASNTNRITLPKAAKATLDALTRKEGTLVYATDLVKPYYDDGSTLREIGSGSGSGGINYITNSSFEDGNSTGWATYQDAAATTPVNGTAGTANSTFAASASSPLRGTYSGLFTKNSGASRQGEGFSYDFTIASADVSRPLLVTWEGSASANYTGSSGSEYLAVYLYDVTNSTLISPASTTVAPGTSKGSTFFVATTSTSYRLIFHVAGTGTSAWTYKIDSISVGPQSIAMGPALTDWQSFTPTGSWSTNTTYTGFYRRSGDSMEIDVQVSLAGAPTATTLSINLPSSFTIDTAKLSNSTATNQYHLGTGLLSAATTYPLRISYDSTTSVRVAVYKADSTYANALTLLSSTVPESLGSGHAVRLRASFPISQWSSSNFQTADRAVEEYAYNSSTTDAADTTSFAYGSFGGQFGNFTATRAKRVRFQSPIQATDSLVFEITSNSGQNWHRLSDQSAFISVYTSQNSVEYGVTMAPVGGTTTDVDVSFSTYRIPSGATFGAAGATWSAIDADNTYRWRVRKVSGGASVGYPVGSQNVVGRVDGVAPATGYVGEKQSQSRLFASRTSITSGVVFNTTATALTLPAGSWKLSGAIGYHGASGTVTVTFLHAGISLTSATLPGSSTYATANSSGEISNIDQITSKTLGVGSDFTMSTFDSYVNISASTTFYLVGRMDWGGGGTAEAWGSITAVRVA